MDKVANIRASTAGEGDAIQHTQIDQAHDLRPTNSSPKRKAEPEPYNGGSQDSAKSAKAGDEDEDAKDGPPYTQADPRKDDKIEDSNMLSDKELAVLKQVSLLDNVERMERLANDAVIALEQVDTVRRVLVRELAKNKAGPEVFPLYMGIIDSMGYAQLSKRVIKILIDEIAQL